MTTDTIHTCSYECERPGCIRAQRDELRDRLEALTAAQRPAAVDEAMLEAVARAICVACEENPDRQGDARGNEFRWQDYRDTALAAISAFTAAQQPAEQRAEVEALRAEVAEAREFRDKLANAIGNDQLRRFIEKHGEPVPLTIRMQAAEARADKLAEALQLAEEHINALTPEWYSAGQRVLAAIRAALKQEEKK